MPKHETLTFRPREFKGSRLRCLLATHQSREKVAEFLTAISGGAAEVTPNDKWAPRGFLHPDEVKLDQPNVFLTEEQRETLAKWWLAKRGRANTPNWDIASTAKINGAKGLLLVEAKAHAGEFCDDRCGATNRENFERICKAIDEANKGWNSLVNGFTLQAEHHYQLSNRFAFAWKLATMEVPVVLIYLGFLNASEMSGCNTFCKPGDWRSCLLAGTKDVVPEAAWKQETFKVNGIPLKILISAADVQICAEAKS